MNTAEKTNNNYIVYLSLILIAILMGCVSLYALTKGSRWSLYIMFSPFLLFLYFAIKSSEIKIATLVVVLFFVESTFVYRRPLYENTIDFVLIGSSNILMVVLFLSYLYQGKRFYLSKQLIVGWSLFFAFMTIPMAKTFLIDDLLLTDELIFHQTYVLEFMLLFIIGCLSFNSPTQCNRFFSFVVALGAVIAMCHLFSIFTGINLESVRGGAAVGAHRDLSDATNWRYGGVFGNPNTMSAFYVMAVPVGITLFLNRSNVLVRGTVFFGMVVMLISLVFAGSRAGVIFLFLSLCLVVLLESHNLQRILSMLMLLLVLFVTSFTVMHFYYDDFLQRTIDRYSLVGVGDVRYELWRYTLEIIRDNPFGVGLHWSKYNTEIFKAGGIDLVSPHNIYLSVATKGGLMALVGFLVIVLSIVRTCIAGIKMNLGREPQLASKLLLICLIGFLSFGLTEPLLFNGLKLNHFFALLLGMAYALGAHQVDDSIVLDASD